MYQIRRAQPLTSDPAVLEASALMVGILAEQVRTLLPALGRLEAAIAQFFPQYPDAELRVSFPGAGKVFARGCWRPSARIANVTRTRRKCSNSPALRPISR